MSSVVETIGPAEKGVVKDLGNFLLDWNGSRTFHLSSENVQTNEASVLVAKKVAWICVEQ